MFNNLYIKIFYSPSLSITEPFTHVIFAALFQMFKVFLSPHPPSYLQRWFLFVLLFQKIEVVFREYIMAVTKL